MLPFSVILKTFIVVCVFAWCPLLQAQLYEENFSYADGSNLNGQGGWSGSDGILVTDAAALLLGGYPSGSGAGIRLTGAFNPSLDQNFPGSVAGDGNTAYLSYLVETPAVFTSFNFASVYLAPDSGYTASNRVGVGFINTANTSNQNGLVLFTGSNTTFDAGPFLPSARYLVIVEYQFIAGMNNDVVNVYVSTSLPASLGVPTVSKTTTEGDPLSDGGSLRISDDGASTIDGLRVGDSFSQVPVVLQQFSVE